MEELQELLSLATFEPGKAYEPYLNTPRSLEACRLNGINPIELVEIPISEFQKDFPNDPDAVQRRFERVDGARRRLLQYVVSDWKQLCASGWAPPKERPQSAKETIVHASAGAHCTLLEIQAQRFRKMEKDNWDALNRQLKMELRQADIEQKNKKITQKHEEIQSNNDNLKKERQQMLEQLHREELERLRKKAEDEAAEVRRLQELDQVLARQKKEDDEQNRLREKQARERREMERVQREQYTKQLKNSIMTGLENQVEQKKKVLSIRDKSMEDRIEQQRRERDRMMEQRRLQKEQRLAKAREDQTKQDEEDRQEMLDRIMKNEEKRNKLQEQKDRERKELNDSNNDASREKLTKIKEANDGVTNGKANKTLEALQLKEELARQELERVKEAQQKRQCIKSIRQEAFKMAAHRARKAHEYKMLKVMADLKNKDDRCEAIKKGFFALDHMRNSMKDIMEKTNTELKHEMHLLRHRDTYSPERVVKKALEVGNSTLFPRLQRSFGISDSPMGRTGSGLLGGGANIFPAEFNISSGPNTTSNRAKSTGDMFPTDDLIPGATGAGGLAGATTTTGAQAGGLQGTHQSSEGRRARSSRSTGKKGFEPLPIQSMTQDRLQAALTASKSRILSSAGGKGENDKRGPSLNNNTFFDDDGAFNDFDNEDSDGEYLRPILKLPGQGAHSPQHDKKEKNNGKGRRPLSPASSQASASIGQLLPPSPSAQHPKSAAASTRPSGSRGSSPVATKRKGGKSEKSASFSAAEDVKLPMFKFDPLRQSQPNANAADESAGQPPADGSDGRQMAGADTSNKSNRAASPGQIPLSLSRKLNSQKEVRTDVNDKASFLEPPPGKFRREFSNDHPLAKNGTGKYTKELKKGVTPAGMHLDVPDHLKNSKVSDTVEVAGKIERLTYTAQRRVVDPKSQIDEVKKQQNATLKRIVMSERDAEAVREQTLRSVADPQERHHLEAVFAEERRRASDRIIAATKEHEEVIRQMVLSMMDLGAGGIGYGKEEARLPMSNFFQ